MTEDYIALGSIRLRKPVDAGEDAEWIMFGPDRDEPYPMPIVSLAERRQWIRTQWQDHATSPSHAALRVFVRPEDVNRSVRGPIIQIRRVIKSLLPLIDTSLASWQGSFDLGSPIRTYNAPISDQEESLFYIFNTLSSPDPDQMSVHAPPYSQESMADILQDNIAGLKTTLYPYQRRSVAAMLQRESDPAKVLDPRKPRYHDLNQQPFYLDVFDGVLLRHAQLYTKPRGGILAETMGYGKTLICIALILATRGHYPKVPEGRLDTCTPPPHPQMPSLLEMAARSLKQSAMPWKAEFHALRTAGYHYDRCIEELGKYDREFAEPIFHPTTPDRKASKREAARILRLCSATLVIVPPNLLVQWQHEIEKHTEDGAIDLLVIDSSTKHVPHWKTLMSYDMVLITKARFEQEYRDDDLNQARRFRGEDRFHSPLTDVRWLRVICDEGHGFAGSASRTNAMAMLDKISIERRWVVSGTPSNSLHGVEVNLATSERPHESRRDSLGAALEHRRLPDTAEQEVKDMERLRLIVVNFLKLQPWANQKGSDHAIWKKYLAPFDASGQRRFAPGLRALLQSLIVRHRIEDIDSDLCLPPLYNTTVYLEPSYYDKLSMNMFVLVLTSNAVTSERTDEDYMHHVKNRKQLDQLISNLRQSSFHWVGFTHYDITETLRVSNAYFDKHIDQLSDQDALLLTEAILNGEKALADPGWCAFSSLHEIGVYVAHFPEHAAEAWALHGRPSDPLLLGTVQAREAQQYVVKHAAEEDPASGLTGAGLRAMRAARERAAEEQKTKEKESNTRTTAGVTEEPKLKSQASPSRSSIAVPLPASPRSPAKTRPRSDSSHSLSSTSPLLRTQIVGFTSAKLTYLIDAVLTHQEQEKIIIFYDANNIAFWIAEALELLAVKFLIYANTLSVARRATYLATFNQKPEFRVLLMDLKQAAHGLHVACASRVYIVSPIWQPNIESQAIKRAHRIGQTNPVYVETLVLRGTLEDKMLKRRKQMSNLELQRAEKSLLDDRTMAEIIKDEKFLPFQDGEDGPEAQVARLAVPRPMFMRGTDAAAADDYEKEKVLIWAAGDVPVAKRRKMKVKIENSSTPNDNFVAAIPNASADPTPLSTPKTKKSVRILVEV